ncbi:MAG: hypothetical protein K0R78_2406 [Pelosinus sp.]|jgi:uncharacterized protein (UPF0297 family)|nr:hypothetical protein [Pelosinus sp.]
MEKVVSIANTLTSIFSGWQSKKEDNLMEYLNTYLFLPQCEKFIINTVNELQSGNTKGLERIYKELMQKGDLTLAQTVGTLVSGEFAISKESNVLLESYVKSENFYKELEKTLLMKNELSY